MKSSSLVIGASLVAVIVLFALLSLQPEVGTTVPDLGNEHIDSIDMAHSGYNSTPPTSGPHVGNIAPWGVHEEQIPDELQVHNLEDGGVIIQYDPDQITEDELEKLNQIITSGPEHLILAPYNGMESRITITAWTKMLQLDQVDESNIQKFIRQYHGIDHHVN